MLSLELLVPEPWESEASCVTGPSSWWFPSRGENTRNLYAARKICRTQCPVRYHCLVRSVREQHAFGVWAGVSRAVRVELWAAWQASTQSLEHIVFTYLMDSTG